MADGSPTYALVAVARPLPEPLTYAIPPILASDVRVGHVVLVPFGKTGETGYVVGRTSEVTFDPAKVRPITRLVDPEPAFDEKQLSFFRWIADYYLSPLGMVIATAIPSEVSARVVRVLEPTDEGVDALAAGFLAGTPAQVYREIVSRPGLTKKGLAKRLADEVDDVEAAIDVLLKHGHATWGEREIGETKGRIATVSLATSAADALGRLPKNARRLRAIVEALGRAAGPVDKREVVAEQGATAGPALGKLVEMGLVVAGEREDRDVLDLPEWPSAVRPPVLNVDQMAALSVLQAPTAEGAHLLFGVTGSGKTEVFLGAAKAVLERGRQVLVLVPEIGLTPQLVGRFKARFGDGVAVLHSGLTGSQRLAEWRRIRAGEAQVAVGARSALFAPFRDLGLVVVDEEHDDSYKQDDGVRYNARDLAVVLGRFHKAPVVLASATPSLESWHNARSGRYKLLTLANRATPRAVPKVELVDMTELATPDDRPRPIFHPDVQRALRETFAQGAQAIVLYNRRGYATMVQCPTCGGTYECGNCGITMTLHHRARVVACHYCGMKRTYDGRCPACHHEGMEELGKGTEKVEDELAALFPDVPMARMDADTTAVRGAHHRILEGFREGRSRLLVGTQIVAKGHDFPDVQTAVVVSADHGFRLPDFRAAERTWALLVQLAGRAGRGERAGRVYLQTWTPDHYVLQHLDDATGFYDAESKIRQTMRYPPFTRLALIRIEGPERDRVQASASELGRALRDLLRTRAGIEVLGPAPAALAKLVGRWRWQIVLRGKEIAPFRQYLDAARTAIEGGARHGVRVTVDVDPRHLM